MVNVFRREPHTQHNSMGSTVYMQTPGKYNEKAVVNDISDVKVADVSSYQGATWVYLNDFDHGERIALYGQFDINDDNTINWKNSGISEYRRRDGVTRDDLLSASQVNIRGKKLKKLASGNGKILTKKQSVSVYGTQLDDEIIGQGRLSGNGGNDYIKAKKRSSIYSGSGDDTIIGSKDADRIFLEGGNNSVKGGGGADIYTASKYREGYSVIKDFDPAEGDRFQTGSTYTKQVQTDRGVLLTVGSQDMLLEGMTMDQTTNILIY